LGPEATAVRRSDPVSLHRHRHRPSPYHLHLRISDLQFQLYSCSSCSQLAATQLRLPASGGKTNCQFNHLTVALRYTSADMRYDYGFEYLQLLLRRLHPARQAIWHWRSPPAPPDLIHIPIPLIFPIHKNWLPTAPDN